MSDRQFREYPHLVELIIAAERHCVMHAAQRVVVDDVTMTEEQAADWLYAMIKRIHRVRTLVEQKPAI